MVEKCKDRSRVHEVDFFRTAEEASEETFIMADTNSVVEGLIDYLEETRFKHCELCGGVHPELVLKIFDKQYYFMLWKIEEKGKTVVKTDCKKLREHLRE